MESRLTSLFRVSGIDLTARAYQAIASNDQELHQALEDALQGGYAGRAEEGLPQALEFVLDELREAYTKYPKDDFRRQMPKIFEDTFREQFSIDPDSGRDPELLNALEDHLREALAIDPEADREQALPKPLENALDTVRRAYAGELEESSGLETILQRARLLIDRARHDSRHNDIPIVTALVEAKIEGLEIKLISDLLEQMSNQDSERRETIAQFAEQLHYQDLEERPERFEKVYALLCKAVEQATTASDLSTLDALVTDPKNFERSIPVDSGMEGAAVAVVKLQGIRARLQMKQLSNTIYAARDRR
jgi:hypothetical protein